jgi:protoheme IX farnesyltransferase
LEQTAKNRIKPNPVMEPGPLSDINRTGTFRDFLTVTKIGITLANMMTVFAGLWLASGGQASGTQIFFTLLGTALVIMAGTCLNNYIDRDLDKLMQRTSKRALPDGRINAKSVLIMGLGFATVGTLILATLVNPLTAILGLIGLFDYVVIYTMWLKRTSTTSTIGGAISGAVPLVMGWTAITNQMDTAAWVLFGIMFLWQMPHTLALAIRRSEDYKKAGIPVLPVVKGFEATKRHNIRYIAATIPASILLFKVAPVGSLYLYTAIILGVLWFALGVAGFFAKDTIKWARQSFVFSLIYLTVINIVMIIEGTI